jgi:broad specificity phosphatase PhoE
VYSSPLARAKDTAAIVAGPHALPVVTRDGLREIGVGEWEGLLMDEIEQRYAQVLRDWWERPHLTRIPGGETLDELRDRAMRAIAEIRRQVPEGAAAVVAHGGVNKTIILTALGAPLSSYWRIRQTNTCINVLEYDGDRARVLILNATAHLGALEALEAAPQGAAGFGVSAPGKPVSPETW